MEWFTDLNERKRDSYLKTVEWEGGGDGGDVYTSYAIMVLSK